MYYQVVALFLLWCGATLGSADIHYVSPINGSCSNASLTCYDFNTYLEYFPEYFESNNITFLFLPGKHIINYAIHDFQNLENISLVGVGDFVEYSIDHNVQQYGFDPYSMDSTIQYSASSSIIICNISTYFSFKIIASLTIANLTILNCGRQSFHAIQLFEISSLIMDGVSVQNSTGYGIVGLNVIGNSQITGSSFIGNNQYIKSMLQRKIISDQSCNPIIEYWNRNITSFYYGGNVLLLYNGDHEASINGTDNLFISSCLFSLGLDSNYRNVALPWPYLGTGLALWSEASNYSLTIKIKDIISYRNQAYYGAGINIIDDSLTFSIIMENILVACGVAFYGGGLTYLTSHTTSTTLSHIAILNSKFTNNYAQIKGSSLYVASQNQQGQNNNVILNISIHESLITCEVGYSSLDIQASNSSIMFNSSYMDWHNTSISNIAMFNGSSNFSSIFNMYQCNLQSSGCLLDVKNSTLHSYGCNFSDAAIGLKLYFSTAAIYQSKLSNNLQGTIAMNSSIVLNDCIFIGNGAAITSSQSQLNVTSGTLIFTNNSCGAIQLVKSRLTVINSDINFSSNNACASLAKNGGALYLNQSVVNFINSSVRFHGNNADVGGAVYQILSSINFESSNLQCCNNTATFLGGCMYLLSSNLSLDITSHGIFSQNKAHSGGGALFQRRFDS